MGQQYGAICENCGEKFTVRKGGGMSFHLLHCDLCGQEKTIKFSEVRSLDLGDKKMSEVEKAEYLAGKCDCDGAKGKYKVNAPPRCPNCGSTEHKRNHEEPVTMYD